MSKAQYNFMVVGLKNGKLAQFTLNAIGLSLYDVNNMMDAGENLDQLAAFIDVNQVVAKEGCVETGQILYIPPLHAEKSFFGEMTTLFDVSQQINKPITNKMQIENELIAINDTIMKLSKTVRKRFANGHHLISTLPSVLPNTFSCPQPCIILR